jgi:glycosyltransferase involved in cell wall biosynthesis
MNRCPVSVVIPVYNGARYLAATLESVLQQTQLPMEIIVVNDGSTDSSRDVASGFKDRSDLIEVISQMNRGVSAARNRGALEASGEWLAFLDADDVWNPTKLERQIQLVSGDPDAVVAGGPMRYLADSGHLNARVGESDLQDRQVDIRTAKLMPFPISSAIVRREAFNTIGGFDEELSLHVPGQVEDLDLIARIASIGVVRASPHELGWYRLHASSASSAHFFSQRRGARYVRARLALELSGDSLTWEEFCSRGYPFRHRWNDTRIYTKRQAGVSWATGDRCRASLYLLSSLLLGPLQTFRELNYKRVGASDAVRSSA